MYPIIRQGKITGTTHSPNETSSTPVDETSQKWIQYLAQQENERAQGRKNRVDSDQAIAAIVQEIESQHPGATDRIKARL